MMPKSAQVRRRRRAIMGTEIVVSIGLMMLIAALTAKAVLDYHRVRDRCLGRQAAAWAADAQLQRYRAGAPFDSRPPAGTIPETVTLEARSEPGREQWEGFTRVTVIATNRTPSGSEVTEQLSAYLPAEVTP